jgi:hypothetical protein
MARTVRRALRTKPRSPPAHIGFTDLPGEVRQIIYRMFAPIRPNPLATDYEDQAEMKVVSQLLDDDRHDEQMQEEMLGEPNYGNMPAKHAFGPWREIEQTSTHIDGSDDEDQQSNASSDPEDSEYDDILTTRRSLLLTSGQVYNEFAPTFYNTTTIVIGRSWAKSPAKFKERFFDTDKTIVTSNIRTIVYYPLKWHNPNYYLLPRPLNNARDPDHHGLELLCQLLTEHQPLQSNLQTLRIHLQPALYNHEREFCWLDTEEHCNEAWDAMDWDGYWHQVVEELLSGPLETSMVRKEIGAVSVNIPGASGLAEMESWRLTFDKRPKDETTG